MRYKLFYFLLFFTKAVSAFDCHLLIEKSLKDLCIKSIDIKQSSISQQEKLQQISYLYSIGIDQHSAKVLNNDLYLFFYDQDTILSNSEINYLKILIATSYTFEKDYFHLIKLQEANIGLVNIEESISIELSLPPYRYGFKKIKEIFPKSNLWAFKNHYDKKTYVMKKDSQKIFRLYFYKEGKLTLAENFCRDKNFFLGAAHKNEEFNKYEACFRFNGARKMYSSASQICFDHHDQGYESPFGTGSGYDSFDNVGIARGYDTKYKITNYYCKYNKLEVIAHGFKDLLPYLLRKL